MLGGGNANNNGGAAAELQMGERGGRSSATAEGGAEALQLQRNGGAEGG